MEPTELIRRALGVPDAVVNRGRAVEEMLWRVGSPDPQGDGSEEQVRLAATKRAFSDFSISLIEGRFDDVLMGWQTVDEAVTQTWEGSDADVAEKPYKDVVTFLLIAVSAYVAESPFED